MMTSHEAGQLEESWRIEEHAVAELARKQEITVNFWDKICSLVSFIYYVYSRAAWDDEEVKVFTLQGSVDAKSDIPLWPNLSAWQLLAAVAKIDITALRIYPICEWLWKSVKLSHVFHITHGQVLCMKQWCVKWFLGLSEAIARSNSSDEPVHLFNDLKINCKSIREAIKQSQPHVSLALSDDRKDHSCSPSFQSSQHPVKFRCSLKPCITNGPEFLERSFKRQHMLTSLGSEDALVIDSTDASLGSPISISPSAVS